MAGHKRFGGAGPWKRGAAILAIYLAVATIFCSPLFERPLGLGRDDWDPFLFYHASVLKSVIEYASPPFWNPWYCSGSVLWQNPQAPLLSPAYLFALVFPFALAVKLGILAHYMMGMVGMHVLVTSGLGVRLFPAAAYLSIVFACSGALALHIAIGHGWVLGAFYLPLHLFFVVRATQSDHSRYAVAAGGVLALMIVNGSSHIVPMAAVLDALLLSLLAARRRSLQPLEAGLVAGISTAMIGAPRLLPIVLFLRDSQFVDHRVLATDWMTVDMLRTAYLSPAASLNGPLSPSHAGFWEYGNYSGDLVVALLPAALIWIALTTQPRRSLLVPLALTTLTLFVVSLGEFGAAAPAAWLRRLPVFSTFRLPTRYTMPFLVAALATIAAAFRDFSQSLVGWRWKVVATVVFFAAAGQVVVRNRDVLRGTFLEPPIEGSFRPLGGSPTLTTDGQSEGAGMLRALFNDTNFHKCYELIAVQRTADPARPLVFASPGATVQNVRFAPNRVDADVATGSARARLFMNQNFAHGWSNSIGPVSLDPSLKVPSVDIPAGYRGTVSFSYSPPGLMVGSAAFLGYLALVSWRWLAGRRAPPHTVAD